MHNEVATGKERTTRFQHALAAGETITGLITATTLVYPDKKIALVNPKSVTKRMKQAAFAASVNGKILWNVRKSVFRWMNLFCLAVAAMQNISSELGL